MGPARTPDADKMHANLQSELLQSVSAKKGRIRRKKREICAIPEERKKREICAIPKERKKREICAIPEEDESKEDISDVGDAEVSAFMMDLEGVLLSMLPREERRKRAEQAAYSRKENKNGWTDVRSLADSSGLDVSAYF
jgi:hypothetical protein